LQEACEKPATKPANSLHEHADAAKSFRKACKNTPALQKNRKKQAGATETSEKAGKYCKSIQKQRN
jgi:hypothetical protein